MIQNKSTDPDYIVGGLYIFSDPPGADIYIDWKPVIDSAENIVKTPATAPLPHNKHYYKTKIIT